MRLTVGFSNDCRGSRSAAARKKRRKAGRHVKIETETELESAVSEHVRDVTEDLLKEHGEAQSRKRALETLLAGTQEEEEVRFWILSAPPERLSFPFLYLPVSFFVFD